MSRRKRKLRRQVVRSIQVGYPRHTSQRSETGGPIPVVERFAGIHRLRSGGYNFTNVAPATAGRLGGGRLWLPGRRTVPLAGSVDGRQR